MKKFYESPVVEITVFDVEDVITASVDTTGMDDTALTAHIDTVVEVYETAGTAAEIKGFSSYTW
jgi:hypothetical protein